MMGHCRVLPGRIVRGRLPSILLQFLQADLLTRLWRTASGQPGLQTPGRWNLKLQLCSNLTRSLSISGMMPPPVIYAAQSPSETAPAINAITAATLWAAHNSSLVTRPPHQFPCRTGLAPTPVVGGLIAIENGEVALSKRSASKGLLPSTFDIRHSIFVLPPTLGFFLFRCLTTVLQYNTFFLVAKFTALVAES